MSACDILVYRMLPKSCDPPDWLIQTCYQSATSHVTETTFLTQICFIVENFIVVSLNTVIPIIVIFVCFVALRPKSTAMVMAGRSVHLTTFFPGQA